MTFWQNFGSTLFVILCLIDLVAIFYIVKNYSLSHPWHSFFYLLALNLLVSIYLRGLGGEIGILFFMLFIFLGLPGIFVGIIASFKKYPRLQWLGFSTPIMIILLLFSTGIFGQWEENGIKKYCASLTPAIEDFRAVHDSYPDHLDEINAPQQLLPLYIFFNGAHRGCDYSIANNGADFYFEISEGLTPSYWEYSGSSGEWHYQD